MPRESSVPPEYLVNQLKQWQIFCDKGKVKKKSDPIWEKIKKSLNLKISSASLYLYVYKNEHGSKEKLQKFFKIKSKEKTTIKKQDDDDYQPHEQRMNTADCAPLVFDIIIPIDKVVDSWSNKKVSKDWRFEFRMAVWHSQQLPCAYALKDGYITEKQFKIKGHCSGCNSDISAEGEKLDEENIKFKVRCFATHGIPHKKKNKLLGSRRKEVKRDLVTMTGSQYREKQLSQLTTPYEPPHLNTSSSCRKLRQEAINEALGYTAFKKKSITNQEFLNKCNVRKLSLEPLNIFYWSDKQVQLWNTLQEKRLPLSFDSTGSLVRRYSFYKNVDKSRPIYYYVLVIGFEGKIIPLLQALLSNHHVPIILEVFQKWIESGAKVPKEISTDGSPTLQNVVCIAFNNMTYKRYNLYCYELLTNEVSEVPKCFYRSDVAHLIRIIKAWTCFANADSRVIDFYLRSVGFLTQVETLDQFQDFVTSVLIVSSSTSMQSNSLCHQKYTSLLQIFKTFKQDMNQFNLNNNISEVEQKPEPASAMDSKKNKLISFIDQLFEKALLLCIQEKEIVAHPNFYYCSNFVKLFQDLCYTFPSWTNVMKNSFSSPNDVANSARSETFFKYYKTDVPNPIIVHKILLKDKIKIDALTNFAFTKIRDTEIIKQKPEQVNVLDLDLENLTISTENITERSIKHILNVPKDSMDYSNHVLSNTIHNASAAEGLSVESSSINLEQSSFHIEHRKLIINGNCLPQKQYFIDCSTKILSFRNTCPFDSISEIITSMYVENTYFKKDVNAKLRNEPVIGFLHSVLEYCQESFELDNYYNSRASISYRRYKAREINLNKCNIDCQDNVTTLFIDLMKLVPSIIQISQCACGLEEKRSVVTSSISAIEFYETGLSNLESILKEHWKEKVTYCNSCKNKSAILSHELHTYIAVDVEFLCEKKNTALLQRTAKNAIVRKTNLNTLPKKMTFGKKTFVLRGVVCFEGEFIQYKSIVHYKTYILETFTTEREDQIAKWTLYDSLSTTVQEIESPEEYMALILFAAV